MKGALLPLLPPAVPAAVPFDYFRSRYAVIFTDLTGDVGGAPGDIAAVTWAEQTGWNIFETLRAVDRRCEALAADDDEAGFRAEVRRLVELFRRVREAYRAAMEAGEVTR